MAAWWKVSALCVVLIGGAAACTRTAPEAAPTTTRPLISTTEPTSTTTTSSTTTTLPPVGVGSLPEYEIAERRPVEGAGDEIVVLLDPASYESLTDLDLYDLVADVVGRFSPISTAHVVDAEEAVDAVLAAEPDAAQAALLDVHYLARLEDGIRIVYLGPFASEGTAILGS